MLYDNLTYGAFTSIWYSSSYLSCLLDAANNVTHLGQDSGPKNKAGFASERRQYDS